MRHSNEFDKDQVQKTQQNHRQVFITRAQLVVVGSGATIEGFCGLRMPPACVGPFFCATFGNSICKFLSTFILKMPWL
jgi:hypothetical protein